MKTVLTLILFSLFVTHADCQTLTATEVPVKVREAHKKKYPAAKEATWKKVKDEFQAEHLVNKTQRVSLYDVSGKLVSSETEVKAADVPKPMTDFIVSNFKGQRPTSLRRLSDNTGKISYAAEIDHMRYVFDDKGHFLKQLAEGEY